jgi:hypothetical protein
MRRSSSSSSSSSSSTTISSCRATRGSAGITSVILGGFCEQHKHTNDQVHRLVDMFAARAGPEAEAETGPDSNPVAAYERHRIRLRMAAGAWRDYHESIHARLPFIHSSTDNAATQMELRRSDERQEHAARNPVESLAFGAPGVGGGHHLRGGCAPSVLTPRAWRSTPRDPGRSKRARWAASSPLRRCGASSPSCCAALKPTGG